MGDALLLHLLQVVLAACGWWRSIGSGRSAAIHRRWEPGAASRHWTRVRRIVIDGYKLGGDDGEGTEKACRSMESGGKKREHAA